jgi:hypothetical protein
MSGHESVYRIQRHDDMMQMPCLIGQNLSGTRKRTWEEEHERVFTGAYSFGIRIFVAR